MAKQFTIEEVLGLLNDLYHNPDTEGKEKASVLLGELQNNVSAWTISDQLLQINRDVESCYFGAQTIRTKIQYAFHELPIDSHAQLRDSLLTHASKVTEATPTVIATQLCLGLADLALQMVSWKHSAKDMIEKFGTNQEHWHFLLEFLTVLPEEMDSRALKLGENRRKEVNNELEVTCPLLLELLTSIVDTGCDEKLQTKVIRVLGSWFNVYALPKEHIMKSKLLYLPFQALMSPECSSTLHEAATECVNAAMYYAADEIQKRILDNEELLNPDEVTDEKILAHNQQVVNRVMQGIDFTLADGLCQGVMSLLDAYHMSVATEDVDKSINFCRIFTEMGESFLEMIAYSPNQGLGSFNTLELLLTCVGHHQYEVADMSFNFWYRLSDLLYKEDTDPLNEIFKPYVQRLIVALCRHCQFDSDYEGIPNKSDEFADFRERVSELVKDIVFVVGSEPVFHQMYDCLTKQANGGSWETTEAALFIMTAVAGNILPEEKAIVQEVLNVVLSIPQETHVMVRYTGIQLVGELCEWIEKHPQALEPVLQFLLAGLQNNEVSTVAAKALQKICEQCHEQMTNHLEGLLQVLRAVDTFNVTNDAALELIKGTVIILSQLPHEQITAGMRQLCAMQAEPLMKVIADEAGRPIQGIPQRDPAVWLDRLAAVFRNCTPKVKNGTAHPCQSVVMETWPVLSSTCEKYQADVRIIERCCRCIRYAVRCLGKHSSDLLSPLVTQMVTVYANYPHSCFLYLGSILVDEYGSEECCVQGLVQMLEALCNPTFALLEKNTLRNHPDTVDDLFRLCLRFIQQSPIAFLKSSVQQNLMRVAIAAATLDHKDANASVTKFLTELVKSAYSKQEHKNFQTRSKLVKALLKEIGQSLTAALLNSSLFSLPTFMIADTAEVLYEMIQVDKKAVSEWLQHALQALPAQNSGGAATATPQQMEEFHKTVLKDKMPYKDVSKACRDFAKLYR